MADNEQSVGVIIVPDAIAEQVNAYAVQLAEEQAAEVEGFAAGIEIGSFREILGLKSGLVSTTLGRTASDTGCKVTGPLFPTLSKPGDLTCDDGD